MFCRKVLALVSTKTNETDLYSVQVTSLIVFSFFCCWYFTTNNCKATSIDKNIGDYSAGRATAMLYQIYFGLVIIYRHCFQMITDNYCIANVQQH